MPHVKALVSFNVYWTTIQGLPLIPLKQARVTINFKLDIQNVPDPEGGHRAVTTLDGKHLSTKPL